MKKGFAAVMLAGVLINSAQAQLFSPEAWGGALWGGLIGGIAGGDCHNGFSGSGAAIGAGVGLIAGTIAGYERSRTYPAVYGSPANVYPDPNSPYTYYAPNAYMAAGYYYRPARPNYAVGGTLVGAASGALIGSASENAGQGALIGAAAGLLIGGIAESSARRQEQAVTEPQVAPPPAPAPSQPAPAPRLSTPPSAKPPVAAPTTIASAPARQIADAPRVPDAPSF
jgi:outer membrane lipoprotein SlyB